MSGIEELWQSLAEEVRGGSRREHEAHNVNEPQETRTTDKGVPVHPRCK